MGTVKETTNFTTADFDLSGAAPYHLVIDGTMSHEPTLAFFDEQSGLVHLSGFSQFELDYGAGKLEALDPKSVKFLVPAIDSQFIPQDLYDPSLKDHYEKLLLDDGVSPMLTADFPAIGAVLLYREYLPVVSSLIRLFPEAERVAFPLVFTKSILNRQVVPEASVLGVHVAHDFVAICLCQKNVFSYYRDFHINSIDDFNYHLIQVLGLIKTDITDTRVLLSGDISRDDSFYQRIAKYSRNIHFAHRLACVSLVAGIGA